MALLALMLLSFLGLTLSLTTSTEAQIARNYTLSRQAYFNAVAGAEAAKNVLKGLSDWGPLLPLQRPTDLASMETDPSTLGLGGGFSDRDWEGWSCDRGAASGKGGVGYGIVFDPPGSEMPFDYQSTFRGQSLNGGFTVWARRETEWNSTAGHLVDSTNTDVLILTVEGVAPFVSRVDGAGGRRVFGASGSALKTMLSNQAVSVMEMRLLRNTIPGCNDYGQRRTYDCNTNFQCEDGQHWDADLGGCTDE
jgi:hypothetical protein